MKEIPRSDFHSYGYGVYYAWHSDEEIPTREIAFHRDSGPTYVVRWDPNVYGWYVSDREGNRLSDSLSIDIYRARNEPTYWHALVNRFIDRQIPPGLI
jgi:hypothetical protein